MHWHVSTFTSQLPWQFASNRCNRYNTDDKVDRNSTINRHACIFQSESVFVSPTEDRTFMRLSTWVLCNFIVCVLCFRSTAGGTCNSTSDCNLGGKWDHVRSEKCCSGNCKRWFSCRGSCWSDGDCDTLRGERCEILTCKNISTSHTISPPHHLTEDFGNNEIEHAQEEYSSSGISGGKVFLLTVLPIVAFLAAALIYCKRSRRLQTPPSNGETTEARQPTQTNIPDEVSSHEVVVINMENPWRPDAPPPYHTLAFDVNQAADQEPAPPSYEEAVRNSTETLV